MPEKLSSSSLLLTIRSDAQPEKAATSIPELGSGDLALEVEGL